MAKKIKKCTKCKQKMKYEIIFHSHRNLFKPTQFFRYKIFPHVHKLWYCSYCKYKLVLDEGFDVISNDLIPVKEILSND